MRDRYTSPTALQAAIRAKANQAARATGMSPGDLVTSFYFQRLLARVFLDDGWLLKGGQSLLIRYPRQARLSRDADLFRSAAAGIEEALDALDRAFARDLDDFFSFSREAVSVEDGGAKVKVALRIGAVSQAPLSVDLVVRRAPTGVPTSVPLKPAIPIDWPDTWPQVLLYPLVDHAADKLCAIFEKHRRPGGELVPSTRYRDLPDLLLIAQESPLDGRAVQAALASEVARRTALGIVELTLPPVFEIPDRASWERGYPKAAKEVTGLRGCRTLAEATAAAEVFVSPLLSGEDPGVWSPQAAGWRAR